MGLFKRSREEPVFFDPSVQSLEDFLFGPEDEDTSQEDTQPIEMEFADNVQTHWVYIPDQLGQPDTLFPWVKKEKPLVSDWKHEGSRLSFTPERRIEAPQVTPLEMPEEALETFDKYLDVIGHSVEDYEYFSYSNPGGNHGRFRPFSADDEKAVQKAVEVDELYGGSVIVERPESFVSVRQEPMSEEDFNEERRYIMETDELSLKSKITLLDLLEKRVRA